MGNTRHEVSASQKLQVARGALNRLKSGNTATDLSKCLAGLFDAVDALIKDVEELKTREG